MEVTREQGAGENLGQLIEELRAKLVPMIDDVGRITRATADTVERMNEGQGTVGRLLTDDTLVRELETAAAQLDRTLQIRLHSARLARATTTALTTPPARERRRGTRPGPR